MPYLIYKTRGETIHHPIRSSETTIGRGDECTVRITGDPEISRIHCSIHRQDPGTYVAIDVASKNGTFLNGQRLENEDVVLADGDWIRVGRTKLHFTERDDDTTSGAIHEIEREMQQGKGYQTIMQELVKRPKK